MKTTAENNRESSTNYREIHSQEMNFGNLLKDLTLLGPAPTRRRELLVVIVSLIGLGIVLGVTQAPVLVIALAAAAALTVYAIRGAVGSRKWSQR